MTPPLVQEFLQSYKTGNWKRERDEYVYEIGTTYPEAIADIHLAVLDFYVQEVHWLNHLFLQNLTRFMPREDFPIIVEAALRHMRSGENLGAEAIITDACFQALFALHPHLDAIFELAPNHNAYYEPYPWIESGLQHYDYLTKVIGDSKLDDNVRFRAWESLIETRHPQALSFAQAHLPPSDDEAQFDRYLRNVGYESKHGSYQPLYADQPLHLQFSRAYWDQLDISTWISTWKKRAQSPAFYFPAGDTPHLTFGGALDATCKHCGHPICHLLTLDPIPGQLPIRSLPKITLGMCVSCVSSYTYDPPFYKHDHTGQPQSIEFGDHRNFDYSAPPFQATTIQLVDAGPRWKWQSHAHSNGDENVNRLGGHPSWIQNADYPTCPQCKQTMSFIIQLDSGLVDANGQEWMWGDSGMVYGFWCDTCQISTYIGQCY